MIKSWHDEAWEDYLYWQTQDKKTFKRINQLIKDIDRTPFENNTIIIAQCRTHYEK